MTSAGEEFTVEYLWSRGVEEEQGASPSASPALPCLSSLAPGELGNAGVVATTPPPASPAAPLTLRTPAAPATAIPPPADQALVKFITPLEDDEDRLDAIHDDEPLRYRTMTNIIGDGTPPGQAPRLFAQLHLTHTGEPTTYAKAQGDPAWQAAMKQDLKAVEKNKT